MWYYNAEIISSPTSMVINDLRYDSSVFRDKEKLKELGIKPYREVTPDNEILLAWVQLSV